jgi:flavorubredoxin
MTTLETPSFAPVAPKSYYGPQQIADDTYVIRSLWGEGTAPVQVYINSMVITGKEPVIVDTGLVATREQWVKDVFSLVEPEAVRWIFISHDDHDHIGNLPQVLEMCPNATFVTTWFQIERLVGDYNFPMNRMRWVNDGEAFDAGDRLLCAIRPPIFDSPTTRGLYDTKTRVYWGSDSFGSLVLGPTETQAEQPKEFWEQGFFAIQSLVSPWTSMADPKKYNAQIDRLAELDLSAIASAHGPVLAGDRMRDAIAFMRTMPDREAYQVPGQETLDQILLSMGAH